MLTGNSGINTLAGLAGNDTLDGGAGADTLDGRLGDDVLTGGIGTDSFLFNSTLSSFGNNDIITDFNVTEDTISLENAIFTKLTTTGSLAAGNFVSKANAVALDSNDFLLYDKNTGILSYDADGNGAGAGAQVSFVTLTGIPVLTAADFIIV